MTTAAAATTPPKLPFPLQDGEVVLELCKRHPIYLWPNVLLQALFGILPIIVAAVLLDMAGALDGTVSKAFFVVAGVYLAYWLLRLFLTWYRYHHDFWVITNQRLIDCKKSHPFDLSISTADLVNVQDMSVERKGILRTLLDYGDIVCQTAADNQDFRLAGIGNPREIQALVDRERDRERLRVRA